MRQAFRCCIYYGIALCAFPFARTIEWKTCARHHITLAKWQKALFARDCVCVCEWCVHMKWAASSGAGTNWCRIYCSYVHILCIFVHLCTSSCVCSSCPPSPQVLFQLVFFFVFLLSSSSSFVFVFIFFYILRQSTWAHGHTTRAMHMHNNTHIEYYCLLLFIIYCMFIVKSSSIFRMVWLISLFSHFHFLSTECLLHPLRHRASLLCTRGLISVLVSLVSSAHPNGIRRQQQQQQQ